MSQSIVRRLVLKDLDLARPFVLGALLAGALSLALLTSSLTGFYVGGVGYMVVLIVLNCLLATLMVVGERKERIAHFVLSLPVSTTQYAVAKLLALLVAFGIPWVLLTGAAVALLKLTPLPNGFIPLTLVLAAYFFAYYCLLLGVALVTESGLWITGVIIAGNVFVNFLFQLLLQIPAVGANLGTEAAVWTGQLAALVVLQIGLGLAALAVSLFVHSRKTEFV